MPNAPATYAKASSPVYPKAGSASLPTLPARSCSSPRGRRTSTPDISSTPTVDIQRGEDMARAINPSERVKQFGPHPEERALARASRRMATGTAEQAAILRDGRPRGRPPQDEVFYFLHMRGMTPQELRH